MVFPESPGHHNNTKRVVSLGYFHIKKQSDRSYLRQVDLRKVGEAILRKALTTAFTMAARQESVEACFFSAPLWEVGWE